MNQIKIVFFKAESDNSLHKEDEYVKLFKENQLEVYCLSPIKFEFKNLDNLVEKLKNFHLNYSSLVITSPRIVKILKYLIQNDQLNLELLRKIPCITIGPQTYKKLINELQITPLINNELLNINNSNELADYLTKNRIEISKRIDLNKPLLYPTSDLSKEELKSYLNYTEFKIEKLVCYVTLPNENLDYELESIFKASIEKLGKTIEELVEKEFLFVFFSPSGVTSVKQLIKCSRLDKMKLISIGPTTKKSIEENKFNLIATSSKPTPQSLLETILRFT